MTLGTLSLAMGEVRRTAR